MIAHVDIKQCPFRKMTELISAQTQTQYMSLGSVYQETFLECIEEECMAWGPKEKKCLLMRKEEKD